MKLIKSHINLSGRDTAFQVYLVVFQIETIKYA